MDSKLSISSGRSLSLSLSLSLFILSLLSPQYPFNQTLPAPLSPPPSQLVVSDTFFSVQQQVIFSFIRPFFLPILSLFTV